MSGSATAAGRVLIGAVLGFLLLAARVAAGESPAGPVGEIGAASQPTRTLTVFVTEDRTGKPLADVTVESKWLTTAAAAEIRARPRSGQPGCDVFPRAKVEAKTNADGMATLLIPAEELENGSVEMSRPGYATARASWGIYFGKESTINPTRVEAALMPAVAIGGIVKNEEGAPVAGVTLKINRSFQFQRDLPKDGETSYRIFADVTTDEQGRWQFEGMGDRKPGHLELQITFEHPDYTTEFEASHESNPPWDELRSKTWIFTIQKDRRPRATLTGRIVDAAGKPLEGAKIWLGEDNFGVSIGGAKQTAAKSDADGRFMLSDIVPHEPSLRMPGDTPPTYAILNIAAAGYHWKQIEWDVLKGSREETFELSPAPPLRVRVVDQADRPIPDVRMGWPRVTRTSLLTFVGNTDAEGVFVFTDYPDAEFTVRTDRDGYQPREFTRTELRLGTLVLSGEPRIRGVVVDAASGNAIERFRVGLQREQLSTGSGETAPRHFEDGTDGRFELTDPSVATHYRVVVEAEGYLTHRTDRFSADDLQRELRIALQAAPAAMRRVLTPDGAAANGALCTVMSANRDQHHLQLFVNGKAERQSRSGQFGEDVSFVETAATEDGNAKLQWKKEKDSAFVYHESGWAFLAGAPLRSSEPIQLQRWSSVRGLLREGGKPIRGARIILRSNAKSDGRVAFVSASQNYSATTDAEGRFSLDRVMPEYLTLGPAAPEEFHWWGPRFERSFRAVAGETAEIEVVADGITIIARLPVRGTPSRTMEGDAVRPSASLRRIFPPTPPEIREKGADAIQAWHEAWRVSPEGRRLLSLPHEYTTEVRDDRTIRFEHVAPGEYRFFCMLWEEDRTYDFASKVSVSESAKPEATIDLGLLEPQKPEFSLQAGMPAPELTAKTAEGGEFQLSSLRGKHVVVDFWATWCGPCLAAMPELKRVHGQFAKDERVAFVGVSLDDSLSDWKRVAKELALPGTQVISKGFAENPVPKAWGVRGIPAVFVIDPAGRVVESKTTPAGAESALRRALGNAPAK